MEKYRHETSQNEFRLASGQRQRIASTHDSHLMDIKIHLGCVMPMMANTSRYGNECADSCICPKPRVSTSTNGSILDMEACNHNGCLWQALAFPIGIASTWGVCSVFQFAVSPDTMLTKASSSNTRSLLLREYISQI